MQTIELRKINQRGKEQMWKVTVDDDKVTTSHGQIGNTIQEDSKPISAFRATNVGRSNERKSPEQALFETVRRARKKVEDGYLVVEGEELIFEQTSDTVVATNLEIPKPTLAKNASPSSSDYKNSIRKINNQEKVIYQPKLDGNRFTANRITGEIFSRKRKPIFSVPHISKAVIEACANLPKSVVFVDGELFDQDLTFNQIQHIVRTQKLTEEDIEFAKQIKANIFDVISNDEQIDRLDYLNQIVESDSIKVVKSIIDTPDKLQKYHDAFVAVGHEGAIIRFFKDGGYQQRRSNYMYKYKNFLDDEYEVVGFIAEKNNPDKLGSVKLKDDTGTEFNARPSMTHEELANIWENQEKYIGVKATIRYQKLDSRSGIPIFGVLKGFRFDI